MTSEVNLNAQNMGGISSEDEFAGMLVSVLPQMCAVSLFGLTLVAFPRHFLQPSSSDSTLDLQPLGKP